MTGRLFCDIIRKSEKIHLIIRVIKILEITNGGKNYAKHAQNAHHISQIFSTKENRNIQISKVKIILF